MKILFFFVVIVFEIVSCNNFKKKANPSYKMADLLQKEVLKAHDTTMPKSMKIPKLQKAITHVLDSINQLLPKDQQVNANYKIELESVNRDLSVADSMMNKWMNEFNLDSFNTNVDKRVIYLLGEQEKIDKVKEAVLNSVQKADSLLKKRS